MQPEIYQYISSIINSKTLLRLVGMAKRSAKITLDLEDSVWDPDSKERTSLLKNTARNNLHELLNENRDLKLGVRINNIGSNEFERDIALLNVLGFVEWDYIVLPMIESARMIKKYVNTLGNIKYKEIIIIVESEKGVRDLPSILKQGSTEKLSKVHFGHFDYFFGSGRFPIPNQDDIEFWKVSEQVISIVEDYGCNYIHSPINKMNDPRSIFAICHNLTKICKRPFGVTTIGLGQTKLVQNLNNCTYTELDLGNTVVNKKSYAEEIVSFYEKNRNRYFGFFHDVKGGIYITPHEYMAARNYLSNHG